MPVALVPTWIPEGYELADITLERSPMKKIYTAIYKQQGKKIVITVRDYLEGDPVYVEQSEEVSEEYKSSGIIYYIFSDVDLIKTKWIRDSYECSISGDVTIEELKMMINSIKKG